MKFIRKFFGAVTKRQCLRSVQQGSEHVRLVFRQSHVPICETGTGTRLQILPIMVAFHTMECHIQWVPYMLLVPMASTLNPMYSYMQQSNYQALLCSSVVPCWVLGLRIICIHRSLNPEPYKPLNPDTFPLWAIRA